MNDCEQLVVAIKLEVRDVGRGPAVDDELVEDFELFAFDECGCFLVFGMWQMMRGAINGTSEAHTQIDAHASVSHDAVEVGFVGSEGKICEKAERAEGEGEDWGYDALKEPGGVEDCAVTSECEYEVKLLRGGPAEVWGPVLEHRFIAMI